jgi:hypothetical protein
MCVLYQENIRVATAGCLGALATIISDDELVNMVNADTLGSYDMTAYCRILHSLERISRLKVS